MDGICGGVSTFSFASFAFIADTSNRAQRTKKIAVTESMVFLGGFIASISGGVWADKAGFAPPLLLVLACYVAIILYVLFKLKEQRQVCEVSPLKSYSIMDHVRKTSNVLLAPTDGRYPLWLTMGTFALLIMAFAGTNNIFILFLYDEPFNWTKSGVAYFLAFNTLLNGLVVLFVLPEFNRCLGDYWTTFIGTVSALLGFIVLGLSATDWMLFTGSTIGAFGSMTIPTMRSSMSKMVSPDSQGSLFSLVSAMEILCVLVSSSVMSKVYEVTHDYYHGFCFLIEAGITLVTIAMLIVHKSLELHCTAFSKNDNNLVTQEVLGEEEEEDNPPVYLLSSQDEEIENIMMTSQLSIMTNDTPVTPDLENSLGLVRQRPVPRLYDSKDRLYDNSHLGNSEELLTSDVTYRTNDDVTPDTYCVNPVRHRPKVGLYGNNPVVNHHHQDNSESLLPMPSNNSHHGNTESLLPSNNSDDNNVEEVSQISQSLTHPMNCGHATCTNHCSV